MNIKFIIHDFQSNIKQWIRSKGTVFWTILFPILLIIIFGAIFSGVDEIEYNIYIQDLDDSLHSNTFTEILQNISVLKIEIIDENVNITSYLNENEGSTAIIIPKEFGNILEKSFINQDETINLSFYYDPSQQTTFSIIQNIVTNTLYEYNMQITGGRHVIGLDQIPTITEDFSFIDYFIPGMIGFTIMTSCIYGSIERNTKFRKDGILRKLLTMPITRFEWIFAKMLFMLFLSFISTIVIIIIGIIIYDLSVIINIFSIIIIISTSFLFTGMGMLISRFVKDEETADMAGGAITFPMMFLAGTFFPLDQMPEFLRTIAQILPLYYVNEGLRNAMIYMNTDKTIYFTSFVLIFALIFFISGAVLTKWQED